MTSLHLLTLALIATTAAATFHSTISSLFSPFSSSPSIHGRPNGRRLEDEVEDYGKTYDNIRSDEVAGNVQFGVWETAYHWVGWFKDCSVTDNMEYNYANMEDDGDDGRRNRRKGRKLSGSESGGNDNTCMLWGIWATYGLDKNMYAEPDSFYDFYNPLSDNGNIWNPQHYMCALSEEPTDTSTIPLDCHRKTTSWKFLGFLREDSEHVTEQVMKHVWGAHCWDYTTFMEARECEYSWNCNYAGVSNDKYQVPLYVGPKPINGGKLIVGLFLDDECLVSTYDHGTAAQFNLDGNNRRRAKGEGIGSAADNPPLYATNEEAYHAKKAAFENSAPPDPFTDAAEIPRRDLYNSGGFTNYGYSSTFSNVYEQENENAGFGSIFGYNNYDGDDYYWGGEIASCKDDVFCWFPTLLSGVNFQSNCDWQMTNFNLIMMTLTYCRSCVIYPTFQDGELTSEVTGGIQEDDLINQCWKFWSHNSYWCDAECVKTAAAQGGLVQISHLSRWANLDFPAWKRQEGGGGLRRCSVWRRWA